MFRALLISLSACLAILSHAQVTPIAEAPLNTGGVSIVRPNVVLLLDDSGSMQFQYTPDYLAYGDIASLCDSAAITSSGTTPTNRLASVAGACPVFSYSFIRNGMNNWDVLAPSPPAYSPDVNQQYYNPEVSYSPPVKADLTTYPSMDGTSTTKGGATGATTASRNWRAIPQDGYGVHTTTTYNIESWPISYYCDQQSTPVCAGDTGYNYPELGTVTAGTTAKRTRIEPNSGGNAYQKAAFGAPNYYRLGVSNYCQEEQLVNCTASTVATGTYIYPARLRFCKDIDKAVCQKNFDIDRGYIVPSYIHVPETGYTAPKYATGTLTVKSLNNGNSRGQITTLSINGQNVAPVSLNYTNSNATTNMTNLAAAIAAKLNTLPNYTVTSSGVNITIRSNVYGSASNGTPVVIDAPIAVVSQAKYVFTIANGASSSLTAKNYLNTIVINGANVAGAPIVNNAGTTNAAFNATTVKNWAQNNGTNGYTATVTTSGTNMIVTMARTDPNDYTLSDDNATGSMTVSQSASGTKVSASATVTKGVSTSATFSYNSGTTATTASGPLLNGADENVSEIDRGLWSRTSIVAGNTYPRGIARTDCASSNCTYNEEMTNFANWFAYYRYRLNMVKTASGQAFARLNDNYRVGYQILSGTTSFVLPVKPFDVTDTSSTAHRKAWYDKLYQQTATQSTPSRTGLASVGRYFGGKLANVVDPIEYSCQKNYTILVTDGYWNGAAGKDLNNNDITASLDSSTTDPRSSRESGVFDGKNVGGTLADVAQYYYNIDLRTTGTNSKNNVPTNARDDNTGQHMNTYTMGLGIDGLMAYRKDYLTATTGDFVKITSGATGCSWESSMSAVCNWPSPAANDPSAVDDLWHAAVNGRGQYFSARTPQDAADGIKQALSDVVSVTGAAAASATSSPNITQSDNFIYSSTYETGYWDGEVVAQRIDYQTGAVLDNVEWRASDKLNDQADALSTNDNARTLLTIDTTSNAVNKSKPFKFNNLTTDERAWFAGHCTSSQFGQCAENIITVDRRPFADDAQNVVEFLRGRNDSDVFTSNGIPFGYTQIFRDSRTNRLGDTVNSVPHYVSKPPYTFDFDLPVGHETYVQFINRVSPQCAALDTVCEANPPPRRPGTLYMAANDGMLHALDGETGIERFGYVPRATMPEMWRLADQNYATRHRYFVDGSPVSMDISTADNVWKTILVGGYRSGGNGYYAMDVTDPTSPKVLWETCNNAVLCKNVVADMGLSFGNPVLTRMPMSHPTLPGKWVVLVTSGYNNVPTVNTQPTAAGAVSATSTGKGSLFVLDVMTGALLKTYATNEGSVTAPINMGKLSTFAPNFYFDGISSTAYSGDLKGNIWRFDLTKEPTTTGAVRKIAALNKDGKAQPISTKIELGLLPNRPEPVLFVATGQYVSIDDLSDNSTQSLYAIRDAYASTTPPSTDNFYANPRTYATKPFVQQVITDVSGVRKMTQNDVDWNTKSGWYVDFPDTGERVSLDPVLVLGTLTVSTNVVSSTTADACEVGGYSWLYQLDYTKGGKIPTAPADAVAYKVPGALVVGTVIVRLPSGVLKIITTTATGSKIPYGLNVNSSSMSGRRLSWRELPQ